MTYLVAVSLVLLLVVVSRVAARRRVRRAAGNVRSTMQAMYSGPHTYREVSLGDFPNLDTAFYEEKTGEFAALDFSFLGDVEDVTVNRAQIGEPTAVRVMLSEDRTVLGFVYHVETGGQTARTVELETVLDDGRFVMTSNGKAAATMSMPPEIDWQFHPGDHVGALVQAHRTRVRDRLAVAEGARPVAVTTVAELIQHQRYMDEIKARFRKGHPTLVTREELQRMGGPERFRTSNDVAAATERDARRG
ncbi:MAG TPA: hypothetical protein VK399_13740 [Longimicrobiaceae bacterium]|nr:hypothetical protein [Longimicrobiaceae bacterium]